MQKSLPGACRSRDLRRDALANRDRILLAARRLFAERGIDVALEEIARVAGVGIATLYRRFPTRAALVEEIFAVKAQQYVAAADAALRTEDPWEGFCFYVRQVCAMQAEDRGFNDVLTMSFPMAPGLEAARGRAVAIQRCVIERAQEQGSLRPDFAAEDMIYVLLANGVFVTATSGVNDNAWKRYVEWFLSACRADSAQPLPEKALTEDEAVRTLLRLSPAGCREHR